jgi:hypothetical protein
VRRVAISLAVAGGGNQTFELLTRGFCWGRISFRRPDASFWCALSDFFGEAVCFHEESATGVTSYGEDRRPKKCEGRGKGFWFYQLFGN